MKQLKKSISFLIALSILLAVFPIGTGGAAAAVLESKNPEKALVGSGVNRIAVLPDQTAGELKSLLDCAAVYDARGNELADGKRVCTGATVRAADGAEYTVIVPGDTDGDGNVDSSDARIQLRASAKIEPIFGAFELAADVSGDARVNAVDARAILRAAAKLDLFDKNTLIAVAILAPLAAGLVNTPPAGNNSRAVSYPIRYSDGGISITVDRQWYLGAWCYIAHIRMTDYTRLKTAMARDRYGASEKISSFVSRNDCLLAVNGDYAEGNGKGVIRNGVVFRDGISTARALYSQKTGRLTASEKKLFSELARLGYTDSFEFSTTELVVDSKSIYLRKDGGKSTQRTLIGTTGVPGEIYLVVTEGKYSDGVSRGLQYWEAGDLLESLGCTLGIALDGGGSSAMVWNGRILNAYNDVREITGFVYVNKY